MSESKNVSLNLGGFFTALFIAIKLAGTSFAAWSWWWILLPIVPILSLLVRHWGL